LSKTEAYRTVFGKLQKKFCDSCFEKASHLNGNYENLRMVYSHNSDEKGFMAVERGDMIKKRKQIDSDNATPLGRKEIQNPKFKRLSDGSCLILKSDGTKSILPR